VNFMAGAVLPTHMFTATVYVAKRFAVTSPKEVQLDGISVPLLAVKQRMEAGRSTMDKVSVVLGVG